MSDYVYIARYYWSDTDYPEEVSQHVCRTFDAALAIVKDDFAERVEQARELEDEPPALPEWPVDDGVETIWTIPFDRERQWFIEKMRVIG